MPEQQWILHWGIEPRLKWAGNIAAACAAYERRIGCPPTHIRVSPTAPAPPRDCDLVWRASIAVPVTRIEVTEELPS